MTKPTLSLDGKQVEFAPGQVVFKAKGARQVPRGMVWMAFHFREGNANWLTNPVYDPISLTAEDKACAVKVVKA